MKKFFSFFAALLFAGSMMAGSYTITFKDAGAGSDSSTGLTSTKISDYVAEGAEYLSAIAATGKVYNAATGYGLKFGNSSNPGAVTLTLASSVKPTSIVMNASQYGASEGSGLLQDSTIDMTGGGGKGKFKDYTYEYDGKTDVTTIIVGTKSKRGYVKSVTVNFEGEAAPVTVANYCQTEITHFNNPAETASAVLLSVGVKGEKTIVRIDKKNAEAANLDFLQVTPNPVGSQLDEGGSEALAIEINTPTPVNDSLTLEILWSTVGNAGNWMVQNLRVAVADCQYATIPLVPMSCAEVYSTAKNDEVALKDVTVTYVNGSNVYVKDETGSMLLFLPTAATWKAGDKLAGIEGVVDVYHGLYEVKPSSDQVKAVVATAGDAPAPVELAVAPVAADINKYVILKNVSVATGEFTTSKATNLDLTIGEAKVVLRNNFKIAQTFDADKLYNIVATVAIYDETMQLYFISAEEQVDPRMKGAYKIGGEGADFASLYDACVAIETNGIKGDVQLLICADLTEAKNPGLINNTDFAITIRPDKDEDRLIKFTQTSDNDGPSGAFVIGCDKGITFATTTTKNITIDGFAEGGDTRRLTFLTEDGFGSKAGPIIFYGDVSNSAIKNCIVKNTMYHTSTSTYAVTLRTEKNTDKTPVNILVENNLLIATTAYNGQSLYFNGSQRATAAGNPHDIIVRNNEMQASTRGVFLYGAKDILFEGNIIKVNQISGGRISHGILGTTAAGVITVRNNKFVELTTVNTTDGDYGIQAITASGGATAWVIENNYITGFGTAEACKDKPTKVLGIRCGDSCVIRHNTIYMPALAYAPSTALMSGNPIGCLYFAGTKQYIAENNLLVSEETVANNSLIRGGLNPNVKNNVFFHKGGNAAVNAAAVVSMTWEEFTAEGANAGSKWAEPKFADAAKGDLAIAEKNEDLKVARLETVLKDIDGKDRAEQTYAGAFEYIEPETPEGVDNIESIEGAQKIFRNGEVLIIRDGKTYNMMGQTIR
ncbi:MAG: hypothetical protein J5688_01290 [Paludibacteraceae bacterium]|nr:hypothetical protein [Paludibacteraceae bacterium]